MKETLEARVEALEREARQLSEQLIDLSAKEPRKKDWRRTVGAFADDPNYEEIVRLGREHRNRDRPRVFPEESDAGA